MTEVAIELTEAERKSLLERFRRFRVATGTLTHGSVADFCESADHVPWLANLQGDLKDLQRPSALKSLIGLLPLGSRIVEIGAGEPHVATILAQLGYDVSIVDPYDGSGRGPTEYDYYKQKYPNVRIIRDLFSAKLNGFQSSTVDCVYSISVLEHVHPPALGDLFAGIRRFLRPGGYSFHLVDHVLAGDGSDFHVSHLARISSLQFALSNLTPENAAAECVRALHAAGADLDTYYLSARGHNLWRGSTPYEQFPFRKVISVATCQQLELADKRPAGPPAEATPIT